MVLETEKIYQGDCIEILKDMPDESIDCVVTSPPYWGLRDYGKGEQLGLEETPEEFVSNLVKVFSEVKRVLKSSGSVWLNLGDSYFSAPAGNKNGIPKQNAYGGREDAAKSMFKASQVKGKKHNTLKQKDLCGIPWKVAFALQADGWYLRQDIIWHKPNPMPESVQDRCTKAHEYIFLLTKSPKYFYDIDAIREPLAESSIGRLNQDIENQIGTTRANGGAKTNGNFKAVGDQNKGANKRSVWTITTKPYKEAHFATFPIELPTYCIKAGCPEKVCKKCKKPVIKESYRENKLNVGYGNQHTPSGTHKKIGGKYQKFMEENPKKIIEKPTCSCNVGFEGGIVLDPFFGSCTTGLAAQEHNRHWVGIELNEEYIEIAHRRLAQKTLFV